LTLIILDYNDGWKYLDDHSLDLSLRTDGRVEDDGF
jgi:hypothetical protein